jgi:serine/threonine-protein kinase
MIVGTPAYMAPEQADSTFGPVNPATDVYALGTIFYEMLTSRLPLKGGSPLQVLVQTKSEKPIPPTRLRPEIPPALESVCLKCLEKDPAQRYPSAAALADDLDCWLRGEPVQALPAVREEPVGRRPPESEEAAAVSPTSIWQRLARFFSFGRSGQPPREDRAPDN